MTAKECLQAGDLKQAINLLSQELRNNPLDQQRRTFLFELLCFAGEYDRCERHLDLIAQAGQQAELGSLLYRAALQSERVREQVFRNREYTSAPSSSRPIGGTVNGNQFSSASDADSRIGSRLEVFLAGNYLLVSFGDIASIEIAPPQRLRDLLWAPAIVRTGPSFKGRDLGHVLVPVLSPLSSTHSDDAVRLGRETVWQKEGDSIVPYGQKLLLFDDREVPLLELRSINFTPASSIAAA